MFYIFIINDVRIKEKDVSKLMIHLKNLKIDLVYSINNEEI